MNPTFTYSASSMSHRSAVVGLSLVLILGLTGCFYSREITHTRRDIEHATGVDFDRGIVVSLGPRSLGTIGWFAGLLSDEEEEARMVRDYVREISRIKVGIYNTRFGFALDDVDLTRLPRFERKGWEVAVRFRDEDALGWVLYREHRDAVRDLYVVVLSDEELVLARVQGHLNDLLARVMEDHSDLTRWVHDDR